MKSPATARSLTTSDSDIKSEVRDLLSRMAGYIEGVGIPVKPFENPSLPKFSALPGPKQQEVLADLRGRVGLLEASHKEGKSLLDTPQLLWRALNHLGWSPASDLFSHIRDDDTVEIYNLDQVQTFRNLQFFRYVSHSLETIHSAPWYTLSQREEVYQNMLIASIQEIMTMPVKKTLLLDHIPKHDAWEINSIENQRFSIEMKVLSPVFEDGRFVAIIAVNRSGPPMGAA